MLSGCGSRQNQVMGRGAAAQGAPVAADAAAPPLKHHACYVRFVAHRDEREGGYADGEVNHQRQHGARLDPMPAMTARSRTRRTK